jgi:signal transduction histidine kinase
MRLWEPPRRSIRLRLAGMLTALFLLLGGTLLGVSYAIVRSNLTVDPRQLAETAAERLGLEPTRGRNGEPAHTAPGEALRRDGDGDVSGTAAADHRRFVAQIEAVQEELADDAVRDLTLQYLAILAAMAVLSGALGWFVSGRVLRPMSDITATARGVSKESLHERIALEGPDDELKQLADTFDSMLGRLEAGFERERAFVRNASHELRTPLSVIRTEADVTLADEPDDPDALRRSIAVMREAGERSERLVDALLTLARAERGDHSHTVVDLREVVRQLIDEAEFDGLRLELGVRPARVGGDRELLRTMAGNLIDNAVRHNSTGGWIEIRTESASGQARLEIANSGPMITAEEAASLTEPFRRLGTARTGQGLGLGLSIAASVAQAHGGHLAIDALERGGVRVSVSLPAAVLSGDQLDGDPQSARASRTRAEPARTADGGAGLEPGLTQR